MNITLCMVTHNAYYAAALTWESYLTHHEKPNLFVFDQSSTDGTYEYFKGKADLLLSGPNTGHGMRLDELCCRVETPYTLVLDSDVQFLGNLYANVDWSIKPFAICLNQKGGYSSPMFFSGISEKDGKPLPLTTQTRFQIHCTIFETERLKFLLSKNISFGFYIHQGYRKLYETGSMIWTIADCMGWKTITPEGFENKFRHWGAITNILYAMNGKSRKAEKLKQYKEIEQELMLLRNHKNILAKQPSIKLI